MNAKDWAQNAGKSQGIRGRAALDDCAFGNPDDQLRPVILHNLDMLDGHLRVALQKSQFCGLDDQSAEVYAVRRVTDVEYGRTEHEFCALSSSHKSDEKNAPRGV